MGAKKVNVLVFSDSHGKIDNIRAALERQIERPDAVIFLGDGLRDMEQLELDVPVFCVRGNCDYMGIYLLDAPDEQLISLGSKRLFITHGHNYGVKSTLSPIISRAKELCADIVLFGHTHEPFEKTVNQQNDYGIYLEKPMILMNPGSIGSYPYSFGSIMIDRRGAVLASHGTLR
ncbi:MAG: metallophosphoesterase [Ruminococcaceae bacterium]|nr:metallophosphoesterase [Oscillospiraceae bacterium]